MPVEELSYTLLNDGQGHEGSRVDLFLTYQVNPDNPAGPVLVTAATGTFDTLAEDGSVIDHDKIVGLDAVGSYGDNDNALFINTGTSNAAFVTGDGISFKISSAADSNDGEGNVNLYSVSDGQNNYYSDLSYNTLFASTVTEAPCFVAGTRLQTVAGEVEVEVLKIGDVLVTFAGAPTRVVWVGGWHVDLDAHVKPASMRPIRVAPGALGPDMPRRPLYISPDHSLFLDGALVPARLLLNGETITQPARRGIVAYHHVEVAPHDILRAEGAAAESFLDLGHTGFIKPDEQPKSWEDACAPLVLAGAKLAQIRANLAARARHLNDIELAV